MQTRFQFKLTLSSLLIVLLLTGCSISKVEKRKQENSLVFKTAFLQLAEDLLKDSTIINQSLLLAQKNVKAYEIRRKVEYSDIAEWVGANFYFGRENLEESILKEYFPNWKSSYMDSNVTYRKSIDGSPIKEDKGGLIFIEVDEETDEESGYDIRIESYRTLALDLKNKEFKQSLLLFYSVGKEQFNDNIQKVLNTESFNFQQAIDDLRIYKPDSIVENLKPAILEKSFVIVYNSLLQNKKVE